MADRQKVIVCFGDSNTHGTAPLNHIADLRRYGPDMRWPGRLAKRLGEGWTVIEEGLPGRTTVHPDPIEGLFKCGLPGLQVVLETHVPMDLITIMLGTNDTKPRFSVGPEDIAFSVELLVRTVLASVAGPNGKAPQVLLIAPPPVLEAGCLALLFGGAEEKSRHFGRFYAEAAKRSGVHFLDAGQHIVSSPIDGVHFDEEQHAKLATAVAEKIATLDL